MQYYCEFDVMACCFSSTDYGHSKWLSNYGDKYKLSFKTTILSILSIIGEIKIEVNDWY